MIMSWTLYMTSKSPASTSHSPPPFSSKAALLFESRPPLHVATRLNCQTNAESHFFSFSASYGYNDGELYTIHFFLGAVDGEPSLYGKHPNHIDILSKGQIILTNALLRDATDANNS